MADLPLTVLSETPKVITLGWMPPVNCIGYVFYINEKRVSNTWDASTDEVRFGKVDNGVYKVKALSTLSEGTHPPRTPSTSENYGTEKYSEAVYSH